MVAREGNRAPGRLRMGLGSPAATPATLLQDAGENNNADARRAGPVPADNLTYHIEQHGTTPSSHAALRECGCPEWVIRCAHFEGRTLVLTGRDGVLVHTCRLTKDHFFPFGLYEVVGWKPCFMGADCPGSLAIPSTARRTEPFSFEAEALAAFYQAERELLAGGDA